MYLVSFFCAILLIGICVPKWSSETESKYSGDRDIRYMICHSTCLFAGEVFEKEAMRNQTASTLQRNHHFRELFSTVRSYALAPPLKKKQNYSVSTHPPQAPTFVRSQVEHARHRGTHDLRGTAARFGNQLYFQLRENWNTKSTENAVTIDAERLKTGQLRDNKAEMLMVTGMRAAADFVQKNTLDEIRKSSLFMFEALGISKSTWKDYNEDAGPWSVRRELGKKLLYLFDFFLNLFGDFEHLLPFTLQEECAYRCSQDNVDTRKKGNEVLVQYYGKWGFKRLYGAQEFFAALFSLLNFFLHPVYFWSSLRKIKEIIRVTSRINSGDSETINTFAHNKNTSRAFQKARTSLLGHHTLVAGFGFFSSLSWAASCLFHARDRDFTMMLDYVFVQWMGGWALLSGLMYRSVDEQWGLTFKAFLKTTTFYFCLIFAGILAHQTQVIFQSSRPDTGKHMVFCVGLASSGTLAYLSALLRKNCRSAVSKVVQGDLMTCCRGRRGNNEEENYSVEAESSLSGRDERKSAPGGEEPSPKKEDKIVTSSTPAPASTSEGKKLQESTASTATTPSLLAQLQAYWVSSPEFFLAIAGAYPLFLCLELADFPPYEDLLDAHALWHLGSVPIQFGWYKWFSKAEELVFLPEFLKQSGAAQQAKLRKDCPEDNGVDRAKQE
ncbi:unnamed protein product [Amoebophrya sp. A120]|nr:unnamed protein product [Amoebophrya sp. A120]|eukprot:GSA120T00023354001.1